MNPAGTYGAPRRDRAKPSLDSLIGQARSLVDQIEGHMRTLAVGLFDLTASVSMKIEVGHTHGTKSGLLHNAICRLIIEAHDGQVMKELGDGVLCSFEDPIKACLASLAVRRATAEAGLITKGSICLGIVEQVQLNGNLDLLGETVDRCARLLGAALPGQMLLDRSLYDASRTFLREMDQLVTGEPMSVYLRGYGNTAVYELAAGQDDIHNSVHTPLALREGGEISADEILAFIRTARAEVIELGIGLSTFAEYFQSGGPADWNSQVLELLGRGVSIKLAALDPDWQGTAFYLKDREDFEYLDTIYASIRTVKQQLVDFGSRRVPGAVELYVFRHIPSFRAICVDASDPEYGRMLVWNHVYGVSFAAAPAMQFSRRSNPDLFENYWGSIARILRDSTRSW